MDPSWAYLGRPNGIDATRQLLRSLALWAVSTWSSRCFFLGSNFQPLPAKYHVFGWQGYLWTCETLSALCLLMLWVLFCLMHGKSPHQKFHEICVIFCFSATRSQQFLPDLTYRRVWRLTVWAPWKGVENHWKRPQGGRMEVHLLCTVQCGGNICRLCFFGFHEVSKSFIPEFFLGLEEVGWPW